MKEPKMQAPERIWAWPHNLGWGGYWRENPDAVKREDSGAVYVRADLSIAAAAKVLLDAMQSHAGEHVWKCVAHSGMGFAEAERFFRAIASDTAEG